MSNAERGNRDLRGCPASLLQMVVTIAAIYLFWTGLVAIEHSQSEQALNRFGAASLIECAALDPCLFIGVAFLGWVGDLDFRRGRIRIMVALFLLGPILSLIGRFL